MKIMMLKVLRENNLISQRSIVSEVTQIVGDHKLAKNFNGFFKSRRSFD